SEALRESGGAIDVRGERVGTDEDAQRALAARSVRGGHGICSLKVRGESAPVRANATLPEASARSLLPRRYFPRPPRDGIARTRRDSMAVAGSVGACASSAPQTRNSGSPSRTRSDGKGAG